MANITITDGRFESKEVHVGPNATPFGLSTVIVNVKYVAKGAIFVWVPESVLSIHISLLLRDKFKFHRYLNGDYVYYFWNNPTVEDKVPEYATSVEGVGAIILSPDKNEVLLIWEYGKWRMVSGAIKGGDSAIETLHREVQEEVGLELDQTFTPKYVGGWNQRKARYGKINDNFSCYVVQAKTKDFMVDGFEIQNARWFLLSDILQIPLPVVDSGSTVGINSLGIPSGRKDLVTPELDAFSYAMISWLGNYVSGFYLTPHISGNVNLVY